MELNKGGEGEKKGEESENKAEEDEERAEVEQQNGRQRMLKLCFLFVMSPFFLLMSVSLIGWNEKRVACDDKAISAAADAVIEIGCDNPDLQENQGDLVMWTCKVSAATETLTGSGDFSTVSQNGLCLSTKSLLYQCVEISSSTTTMDTVGGEKTTVTTYSYSKRWVSSWVNPSGFKGDSANLEKRKNACVSSASDINGANPVAAKYPGSVTAYAASATAGAWQLDHTDISGMVSCNTQPQDLPSIYGWNLDGNTYSKGSGSNLGDMKVSFYVADPLSACTGLGVNTGDGKMTSWTAPKDWLCDGSHLSKGVYPAQKTKGQLFAEVKAGKHVTTWILRIVFWIILWCSCMCLAGPLDAAADCVPCFGRMLGDVVDRVVCVVTCPPSLFCCFIVAGAVWFVMRPLVGVSLLVSGIILILLIIGQQLKNNKTLRGKKGKTPSRNNEENGGQALPAEQIGSSEPRRSCPCDDNTARDFINALRAEYVDGGGGTSSTFSAADDDTLCRLQSVQDRVRNAGNAAKEIDSIEREWGLA